MKSSQTNYKYFTILNEKVVGGVTAAGNSVLYAIPTIPDDDKDNQARAIIKAIEGDGTLKRIVTTFAVKSGTPEWEQFLQQLMTNPEVSEIVRSNLDMFRRYRISRTTNGADEDNMKVYDQEYEASRAKTSFPSFQHHWEDSQFHRAGGSPRDPGPPKRSND